MAIRVRPSNYLDLTNTPTPRLDAKIEALRTGKGLRKAFSESELQTVLSMDGGERSDFLGRLTTFRSQVKAGW